MKKILSIVLVLVVGCIVFFGCDKNDDKAVLQGKTIEVSSVQNLLDINKNLGSKYQDYTYNLTKDLDINDEDSWNPIGTKEQPFTSKFNGNGHTINITIKGMDEDNEWSKTIGDVAGVFGYIKGANITNANININYQFYEEYEYSYIGGLVAYDLGNSTISDIKVDGDMKLGNLYKEEEQLDENHQGTGIITKYCDIVEYIGGVVGYSANSSKFEKLNSSVSITHKELFINEKKETTRGSRTTLKTEKSFVGGVFGLVKGALLTKNLTSSSLVDIEGQRQNIGGIAGYVSDSNLENLESNGFNATALASSRVNVGGLVGSIDNTTLSTSVVSNNSYEISFNNGYNSANIAGAVAYANNRSVIKDLEVNSTEINLKSETNDTVSVAGLVGMTRESKLLNSTTSVKFYALNATTKETYEKYSVFSAKVFGNSELTGCSGNAKVVIGGSEILLNNQTSKVESTTYINSDAEEMFRFADKNDLDKYVGVVVVENDNNSIDVKVFDEINEEIFVKNFAIVSDKVDSESTSLLGKYIDLYAPNGVLDMKIDGYNLSNYQHLTGVPKIENNNII